MEARVDGFITQTLELSVDTIEQLSSLLYRLNAVFAPVRAMRTDQPYKAAQYGYLAEKADSIAKILDHNIKTYEGGKQRGLLPGQDHVAEVRKISEEGFARGVHP